MTRTEARMIAEELFKLVRPLVVEQLKVVTSEVIDETFGIKEAAKYLGCKEKTIYNKIKEIPHFKIGRTLRFSRLALDEYIRLR